MDRRTLLKLGVGGAALLAVAGGGLSLMQPGIVGGRLTHRGREVFAAVARAVIGPLLPAEEAAREVALQQLLLRLDATITGLPPALQAELSQLLALLASAPGRLAFARLATAWPQASLSELELMLEGLRHSSLLLRQQTYHALRDLCNAAWFADPATWQQIGYPGPQMI